MSNQRNRKWTLYEHWRRASIVKRIAWFIGGATALFAGIAATVYVFGYFQSERHFNAEHMPLIIHNRPPKFLQTYKCVPARHTQTSTDRPKSGDFYIGNIEKSYKNIGNATAYDVSGAISMKSFIVPVKPTGNPFWDEGIKFAPKDCATTLRLKGSPVEPGVEETLHLRQAVGSVPPQVAEGDLVRFQFETCTTYSDAGGGKHGTCDLYTLYTHLSNLPEIDQILGTAELPCDGIARTADFVPVVGAHCQQ